MKRVEEMKKMAKKKKKKRRGSLSHTADQGSAEPTLSEQHNRANKQKKEEEPMFSKRERERVSGAIWRGWTWRVMPGSWRPSGRTGSPVIGERCVYS